VFSLLAALFADKLVQASWLLAVPAVSLIVAHVFYAEKSKRLRNISFYFSLLFLICCQVFLPL
jgi:hypothetical protein